jgi:hypothetical protein
MRVVLELPEKSAKRPDRFGGEDSNPNDRVDIKLQNLSSAADASILFRKLVTSGSYDCNSGHTDEFDDKYRMVGKHRESPRLEEL